MGGQTGTTDDFTDALSIGFDPEIIGVSVGYDEDRYGNGEQRQPRRYTRSG